MTVLTMDQWMGLGMVAGATVCLLIAVGIIVGYDIATRRIVRRMGG